jgi:hypothetical protein
MIKWKKPNGATIETNDLDSTIEHCLKIGWKKIDAAELAKDAQEKADEAVKAANKAKAEAEAEALKLKNLKTKK